MSMSTFWKRLGKKAIIVAIVLIGITLLSFCLSYLSPSDPAKMMLDKKGAPYTQEMLDALRHQMGLDKSFFEQYFSWLGGMITGDMGNSLLTGKSVASELFGYLPNTLIMAFTALAFTMIISVVLGVLCAVYADSVFDYIIRVITYFFASFPNFFLALILLNIFAVRLGWFKVAATMDAKGMVLPVLLLVLTLSAHYIRQVRAVVLEQMSSKYVVGCHARGVPFKRILYRHVLKNSWVPIITLVGISFGGMLGGSAIVETIFTWQGIGKYALTAIQGLDYTVIQVYVVWMAVIFMAVNLMTDLVCTLINPQIYKTGKIEGA